MKSESEVARSPIPIPQRSADKRCFQVQKLRKMQAQEN